jgi:hypothetical protein
LEQLTATQLAEWEVYDRIDPTSDYRIEALLAQGLSHIANLLIQAHFKKGSELTKPEDFLVDWSGEIKEERQKKQSVDEMKRFMLQFAKKQNETVREQERKKVRK